jgi:hypothetical protein
MKEDTYLKYYQNNGNYDFNKKLCGKKPKEIANILVKMDEVREKILKYGKLRNEFRELLYRCINCMTSRKKFTVEDEITVREDNIFVYHTSNVARIEDVLGSEYIVSEIKEYVKNDDLKEKLSKVREDFISINSPELGMKDMNKFNTNSYLVEEVDNCPVVIDKHSVLKIIKYKENHFPFEIINVHRYRNKKFNGYNNSNKYNDYEKTYSPKVIFNPTKTDLTILANNYEYFDKIIQNGFEKLDKRIRFYENETSKIEDYFKSEIVSSNLV